MEKLRDWREVRRFYGLSDKQTDGTVWDRIDGLEDRLSAVIDWIIEREKRGGGVSPKRKSK